MKAVLPFLFIYLFNNTLFSQTLGGVSAYNFLRLPPSPQITGLGGINISQISHDGTLSYGNPALLQTSMKGQLNMVFNRMPSGISNYFIQGIWEKPAWQSFFAASVNYFNYGSLPETDAAGNILGEFRPIDYVIQVSAARAYMERWHYGVSVKFIHSSYAIYRSSALAADLGIRYSDSSAGWQAGFTVLNIGGMIRRNGGLAADELPFDMQLGISKKLPGAPIQFSLTAHHLYLFDLRYNDSSFNTENGLDSGEGSYFFDKLFRHVIISSQLMIGDRVEISVGYNYLRRKELNFGNAGNGFNGFSMGVGVILPNWQFRYARSYYQNSAALNQFALGLNAASILGF
ncbi:MAG TPA: type IX secretion system protein PorQ [Chitinophagaceae bacterium]|nr:type IX secretion system protein PorQ [Chitinophagaceae bacterium]